MTQDEPVLLKRISFLISERWRSKDGGVAGAIVAGEDAAFPAVHACADDVGFGFERGERFRGGGGVTEVKRGGGIVTDDFREGRKVSDHALAEGDQFVGGERGASQQKCDAAGEHDDQQLLAPDGKVAKDYHKRLTSISLSRCPRRSGVSS